MKLLAMIVFLVLAATAQLEAATLTWQDNSDNEHGFIVKRKLVQYQPGTTIIVNAGVFSPLIQLNQPNQQQYTDLTAVADINYDNEYFYLITAWNLDSSGAIQESASSNQASILIPRPVPPVALPLPASALVVSP